MNTHCCTLSCAQSLDLCFVDLPYVNLLCLKYQMDKIALTFPSCFLFLWLDSLFFISVQWLLASCTSTSMIMDRIKYDLSGCYSMSLKFEDSFFLVFCKDHGTIMIQGSIKFLWISWMCWFYLVRNIWGFLATSYAPITANDHLENKPYFCLGLLANLADLLISVDSILFVLGIFDHFYPS